jgi:hypothetical protein
VAAPKPIHARRRPTCARAVAGVVCAIAAALAISACNTGNAPAVLPSSIDGWSCQNYSKNLDRGIELLQQKLIDNPATNISRFNNFDESKMAEQLRLSVTRLCNQYGKSYFPSASALNEVAQVAEGKKPPLTPSDSGTTGESGSQGSDGNAGGNSTSAPGTGADGQSNDGYPVCDPNNPYPPCHEGGRNGPLMTGSGDGPGNNQPPGQSGNAPQVGSDSGQSSSGGGNGEQAPMSSQHPQSTPPQSP